MGVAIRSARADDAAAIAAIYAPHVEQGYASFEERAPDAVETAERIASAHEWLVAEDDEGVAGFAYASEHRARAAYRWSVDVTIYIDARAHRRGVGRALYGELFDRLRAQGFVMAFAGIALPNEPSVALHEALGFTPVGIYRTVGFKAGAWRDVGWWGMELQPPPALPVEPRVG